MMSFDETWRDRKALPVYVIATASQKKGGRKRRFLRSLGESDGG